MKKLILISAIALSGLFYNTAKAQISVHLGVGLFPRIHLRSAIVDVQAAPVAYADDAQGGYNANDDYYYLPDVNAYYNVAEQCYYYFDGDNWISAAYLPGEYRDYDWRNARRYEVRAPRPYMHNDIYMNRYHGNNNNWAHRDDHFNNNGQHNVVQQNNGNDRFNHDVNHNAQINRDNGRGNQHLAQNTRRYESHNNGRRSF